MFNFKFLVLLWRQFATRIEYFWRLSLNVGTCTAFVFLLAECISFLTMNVFAEQHKRIPPSCQQWLGFKGVKYRLLFLAKVLSLKSPTRQKMPCLFPSSLVLYPPRFHSKLSGLASMLAFSIILPVALTT